MVLGALLPPNVPGAGASLLIGSLVAGWGLLAVDGRHPGALGFHLRSSWPSEAILGLGLGVLVGLVVVTFLTIAGAVSWTLEEGTPGGYLSGAGSALAFFLLPAAGEEAFFRGYPLLIVAGALGPGIALIATSLVFGVMHLGNPEVQWIGALNVAVMGLFLGALLLRTKSLWWASGAHLGWNVTLGFVADLPVSGLDLVDAPYVVVNPSGRPWLSGGAFGPEGSIVTTVVGLAAAAWVWWTPRLDASSGRDPEAAP
jgi:membrane protease YdiL (CAAX protease family)